jgi:hypothetical protein
VAGDGSDSGCESSVGLHRRRYQLTSEIEILLLLLPPQMYLRAFGFRVLIPGRHGRQNAHVSWGYKVRRNGLCRDGLNGPREVRSSGLFLRWRGRELFGSRRKKTYVVGRVLWLPMAQKSQERGRVIRNQMDDANATPLFCWCLCLLCVCGRRSAGSRDRPSHGG